VHIVARGETLSLIARRYASTWQSVVYWNRDRYPSLNPTSATYDPNALQVGWTLVVWPAVVVPFNAPMPTATPRPTAAPSTKPAAPPAGAASALVYHGSRASRRVALTFDGDGRAGDSVAIVQWLRDHEVPATFFITGEIAATTTGRQLLSVITSRPDLFDLGNHSYSHPDMSRLTVAQVVSQLERAEAAILTAGNRSPRPLFRPPYGAWDNDVLIGARRAGYPLTVLWDVDPVDWKPVADGGPTAAQITANVLDHTRNGSIVLDHLSGWNTLDALPGIVAGLRARGFTLLTLDRLVGSP
jgi:peptidoglycan/xylan/chitin deacetylase (PgdA/CDA1 family)